MAPPAPAIDSADRLSRLPDEILAQILSLLPAQEAVRMCVLARTWRDVWKITKRLLIKGNTVEFVDGLLRVRLDGLECAPLDACEIMLDPIEDDNDSGYEYYYDYMYNEYTPSVVNSWICRVLKCQVKELRVGMGILREGYYGYSKISKSPLLFSRHLTRLVLRGVWLCSYNLNFSGCPALEDLEINYCNFFGVEKITSPSLKRLLMSGYGDRASYRFRIQIYVHVWFRCGWMACNPGLRCSRACQSWWKHMSRLAHMRTVALVMMIPWVVITSCGLATFQIVTMKKVIQMILLHKAPRSACFLKV